MAVLEAPNGARRALLGLRQRQRTVKTAENDANHTPNHTHTSKAKYGTDRQKFAYFGPHFALGGIQSARFGPRSIHMKQRGRAKSLNPQLPT